MHAEDYVKHYIALNRT